jgi:Icc-related predicted phosphoesterase
MTRIFFATDVHGNSVCWYKFISAGKFYQADVIILGGDMTGKAIVPIVEKDHKYNCCFLGKDYFVTGGEDIKELEQRINMHGFYSILVDANQFEALKGSEEKRDQLFQELMIKRVKEWMNYAATSLKDSNVRCYINPGNDDSLAIDPILEESEHVINCEGKVIDIDEHHQLIGSGWANPTPWKTPRECSEEELRSRIEGMMSKVKVPGNCIFELHAPPYDSGLDAAPELDKDMRPKYAGHKLVPVGSTAVRDAITKIQPLLGLHGHVHESHGVKKIGRTLCVNPGSMYSEGILLGYLINLDKGKIKSYAPTSG